MAQTEMQKGFERYSNLLVESGFPDITPDVVSRYHAMWQAGLSRSNVIPLKMAIAVFEKYPSVFGVQVPASSMSMAG